MDKQFVLHGVASIVAMVDERERVEVHLHQSEDWGGGGAFSEEVIMLRMCSGDTGIFQIPEESPILSRSSSVLLRVDEPTLQDRTESR